MLRISAFMDSQPVSETPAGDRSGAGAGRSLLPLVWILLGALVLAADYADVPGLYVRFPVAFIVPVALAARFSGLWWGLALAFALPLARFFAFETAHASWGTAEAAAGTMIRIDFLAIVVLAAVGEMQRRSLLGKIRSLKGTVSVCVSCRNVRGREGLWMPAGEYVATCSESLFRHGTCPECVRSYLGYLLVQDAEARGRRPEREALEVATVPASASWKAEGDFLPRSLAGRSRSTPGGARSCA